jgi:alcohol dehydrogenase class IV
MVRRAKKTTKKTTKKKTVKRRVASKKKAPARKRRKVSAKVVELRKEVKINESAQWTAYQQLQRQIERAWHQLRTDVEHNANPHELIRDKNELLLLLGECNYMASECMRVNAKKKR